ncbi:MAG: 1-(5-phosphoribosyl)-5-[(5-phosphoribosylamino)methylideneamino]imidazole-4-carboxamide isomerase [Thermomicrobiales bacterium]
MNIYPAIDIRGGRAVRLVEGDFSRETQFDADPVDAARRWQDAGAAWIHIVDLDGARDGTGANREAIARIRQAVPVDVRIEVGGGIRSEADLEALSAIGVDRFILGSIAITDPAFTERAIATYGDAIAVGLDARNGKVATQGWLEQTDADAIEVARRYAEAGLRHVIFTDIQRDGTLQGPNLDALRALIAAVPIDVIASGGVGSLADVEASASTGAGGVIIGSALYHGKIALTDALAIGAASTATATAPIPAGETA